MDFTITVQRAEEHAATLKNLAARLDDTAVNAIGPELEAIGLWLEGEVKRRTPTDTDVLRNSIFSELRSSGAALEEIVSAPLDYAAPVEFGRKPGKMPPPDALRGWAGRKLGDESLAFAVARSIGRKGTKPREMFQSAWADNLSEITSRLQDIGVHITEALLRQLG